MEKTLILVFREDKNLAWKAEVEPGTIPPEQNLPEQNLVESYRKSDNIFLRYIWWFHRRHLNAIAKVISERENMQRATAKERGESTDKG